MKQLAKLLLVTLCVMLTLGQKSSGQSAGQCLYDCQGSTCSDFGNNSDMCIELRAKCQARCSGRRWWGAIAYSARDQRYGWSNGWNNVEDAKKTAMDRCAKAGGAACKLWAWFENECGAIAADGNNVAWGTAYLPEKARQRAVLECKKAGGKNCTVQVWACSHMSD